MAMKKKFIAVMFTKGMQLPNFVRSVNNPRQNLRKWSKEKR